MCERENGHRMDERHRLALFGSSCCLIGAKQTKNKLNEPNIIIIAKGYLSHPNQE